MARKRSIPYSRAEKHTEKSNNKGSESSFVGLNNYYLIVLILAGYTPREDSELDPMDPAAYSEIPR